MKIKLLVVLYGKELHESNTLISILSLTDKEFDLCVFNNGPKVIETSDDFYHKLKESCSVVEIINHSNNKPLSKLYNDFIKQSPGYDIYSILDDDSNLQPEFISTLKGSFNRNTDMIIPVIIDDINNKPYYPLINGEVLSPQKGGFYYKGNGVISIGSGISLTRKIIDRFKDINEDIFDEKYAFYGVDVSVFKRMDLFFKGQSNYIITSELSHSLSINRPKQEKWRVVERLYDEAITIRNYIPAKWKRVFFLLRLIFKCLKMVGIRSTLSIIYVYFRGKHPRT